MKTRFAFPASFNVFIFLFLQACWLLPLKCDAQFVKGADIGWLEQMEATGYKFYDNDGVNKECLQILKEKQINTVRLRVWVNPSDHKTNGFCSKKEVAKMAVRARDIGMRVMIDFHYSDSWADPSKQTKPAAWTSHSFSQLLTDVYNHTYQVLDTLKSLGVTPEWVQIGNEIAGGLLWPDGKSSNWPQLSQLLNKGYDAAKAVDQDIKVIIHLESGNDNNLFRWFFDNAKNYQVKYDIIGMSYYPFWIGSDYTASIESLGNNLNDMAARYGKEVMVVETGGEYNQVQNTFDMLQAVIRKVSDVPNHRGLGVIYWEPEGEKTWSGYSLSCWGDDGRPTAALDAFLTDPSVGMEENALNIGLPVFPNPGSDGILHIDLSNYHRTTQIQIFDINGKILRNMECENQQRVTLNLREYSGLVVVLITNGGVSQVRKVFLR